MSLLFFSLTLITFAPIRFCVLNFGKPFTLSNFYLLVIGIGRGERLVEEFLKANILNRYIEHDETFIFWGKAQKFAA